MKVLPTAAGNMDQHYRNLNARDGNDWSGQLGNVWEIDEETFCYFLDLLPPMRYRGDSFLVSEPLTSDIHPAYFKNGHRYFSGYVRLREADAGMRAFCEGLSSV
ncbi:MAG: DUF1419 domain-containing protein [Parvibaculum sp.]|jgi:hypothetical protein